MNQPTGQKALFECYLCYNLSKNYFRLSSSLHITLTSMKVKLCIKSYYKTSKIPAKAEATIICIKSNLFHTFIFLDSTVRIMTEMKII